MAGLKGTVVAAVTPFSPGGAQINFPWIPGHLRFLERNGIGGVLVSGTNGEGPSLSLAERKQLVDMVIANKGNLAVIVGTGCASLVETVELSQYAFRMGADAILVVPPFFFKNLPHRGVIEFYRALFKALPNQKKVMLYNIPSLSGVEISDEVVDALVAEFPRKFLGIKDTSRDIQKTWHYIERYPQLKVFVGSDELATAALQGGAAGCISVIGNAFPDLPVAVYQAVKQRRGKKEIERAQAKLSQVKSLVYNYPSISALKLLVHLRASLPHTYVRPPLAELTQDEANQLQDDLRALLER